MYARWRAGLAGLILAGTVAGGLGAMASSASAAPTGSKNATTIPAACNEGTVDLVLNNANGQGQGTMNGTQATFAPAHVQGSNLVAHPVTIDLVFTFTPPGGPSQSFSEDVSRHDAKATDSCSINYSASSPQGSESIVGTVTLYYT